VFFFFQLQFFFDFFLQLFLVTLFQLFLRRIFRLRRVVVSRRYVGRGEGRRRNECLHTRGRG
jgi:hypothetical protein